MPGSAESGPCWLSECVCHLQTFKWTIVTNNEYKKKTNSHCIHFLEYIYLTLMSQSVEFPVAKEENLKKKHHNQDINQWDKAAWRCYVFHCVTTVHVNVWNTFEGKRTSSFCWMQGKWLNVITSKQFSSSSKCVVYRVSNKERQILTQVAGTCLNLFDLAGLTRICHSCLCIWYRRAHLGVFWELKFAYGDMFWLRHCIAKCNLWNNWILSYLMC